MAKQKVNLIVRQNRATIVKDESYLIGKVVYLAVEFIPNTRAAAFFTTYGTPVGNTAVPIWEQEAYTSNVMGAVASDSSIGIVNLIVGKTYFLGGSYVIV